jgi:hypothetical protein
VCGLILFPLSYCSMEGWRGSSSGRTPGLFQFTPATTHLSRYDIQKLKYPKLGGGFRFYNLLIYFCRAADANADGKFPVISLQDLASNCILLKMTYFGNLTDLCISSQSAACNPCNRICNNFIVQPPCTSKNNFLSQLIQ